MNTIAEFIKQNKITMTAEYADRNPNISDDAWAKNADHWKCVLRMNRRQMTTYFSMGSGHNGEEPTADDVIYSLSSDASGFANARDFADWCNEYGYDDDRRKTERTYNTIMRQSAKLQRFLGSVDLYTSLLFDTESL